MSHCILLYSIINNYFTDSGIAKETDWGIQITNNDESICDVDDSTEVYRNRSSSNGDNTNSKRENKNSGKGKKVLSRNDGKDNSDNSKDWVCEIEGVGWWRKKGVDRGENGYRCRWTAMGGVSDCDDVNDYSPIKNSSSAEIKLSLNGGDCSESKCLFSWKETWWEKANYEGYKELGAEKSGHDHREGTKWGETWKELYYTTTQSTNGSGIQVVENIERHAEKWAIYGDKYGSNVQCRSWSENWHEHYDSHGNYFKSVEKIGAMDNNRQSWTERWGESHKNGRFHNWTDKWAENHEGTRWGDKWDEDFDKFGNGWKNGETWREAKGNDRWSRKWGEEHNQGTVRKYGSSTAGEQWDLTVNQERFVTRKVQHTWRRIVNDSKQLMAIDNPLPPDDS